MFRIESEDEAFSILKRLDNLRKTSYSDDYGSYDYNRGINSFYNCIKFNLIKNVAEEIYGLKQWKPISDRSEYSDSVDFWIRCINCDYYFRVMTEKLGFYCPECGSKHFIIRNWNIVTMEIINVSA